MNLITIIQYLLQPLPDTQFAIICMMMNGAWLQRRLTRLM